MLMCVSMKTFPFEGWNLAFSLVFICVGADRSTLRSSEWKMLGVPPRRLSRHLSPPGGSPLNVANEAAVTRRASEGGIRQRPRLGIVSREGDLSERGGHSAFAARRRRGRSNNSALRFLYAGYFSARERSRGGIARIDGGPLVVHATR